MDIEPLHDGYDFRTAYGAGVLDEALSGPPAVVVTMPDLVPIFGRRIPDGHRVMTVDGIEEVALDALARECGSPSRVIGLGGGTALDAAKYVAWKHAAALVSIPTVASVDACFTAPAAVRVGQRVRYVGHVVPDLVCIDFDVIAAAPAAMNRIGIGDVLSIHTGVHDWRRAVAAGHGPPWDSAIAEDAMAHLDTIVEHATGLAAGDSKAIQAIFEAFRWVGRTERRVGHCRFEEGSEHYFAYCIEHQTGKRPPHGHLVCMGVLLASVLQDNDPGGVRDLLHRAGIDVRPAALGFDWAEVESALRGLRQYVRREGLAYGAIDEVEVDDAIVERCRDYLTAAWT